MTLEKRQPDQIQTADPAKEIPQPVEVVKKDTFKVFYPGMTGGGQDLTAVREFMRSLYGNENVHIPSSISHRAGLKKGEKSLPEHYKNVSDEIANKAGESNISVIAHSLGGLEVIDLLKQLVENPKWKGNEVNVNFYAVPGFGKDRMSGLIETGKRFVEMNTHVTGVEQHIAYPLPESLYAKEDVKVQEKELAKEDPTNTLYKDTSEQRTERRNTFMNDYLPKIVPEEENRKPIVERLQQIDNLLQSDLKDEIKMELMKERQKILHPHIQSLFKGKHIEPDKHKMFLEKYGELEELISPILEYYKNFALYLAQTSGYIGNGMEQTIADLALKAKEHGKNVRFSITIPERDTMIKKTDIPDIQNKIDQLNLSDIFTGFLFLEQYAHSSIAYKPEPIKDIYETLDAESVN